jgi:hypothetical protein
MEEPPQPVLLRFRALLDVFPALRRGDDRQYADDDHFFQGDTVLPERYALKGAIRSVSHLYQSLRFFIVPALNPRPRT